jgi:hypothetical protein
MKKRWLNHRWKSLSTAIKRTIKKQSSWITVLGAAVVFAMFVVKDAYRDELRDVANSISEAQRFFVIDASFMSVDKRLQVIQNAVGRSPKSDMKQPVTLDNIDDWMMVTTLEDDQKQIAPRIAGELESIGELLRDIPDQKEDSDHLAQISIELNVEAVDADNLIHKDWGKNATAGKKKEILSLQESVPMRVMSDRSTLADLDKRTKKLYQKAFLDANLERLEREKRLRQATIASYVLYPLGWVIGLLGKLYGDGESSEVE